MQTYLVGGAVRDSLLGLPVQDRDWVVVGATPEQMVAHGFLPVGKDFPVFLHPVTHEEYALARTERKTAPGHKGFLIHAAPDVTLEEDLARRDLTINSIANYSIRTWENSIFYPSNTADTPKTALQSDKRAETQADDGDDIRHGIQPGFELDKSEIDKLELDESELDLGHLIDPHGGQQDLRDKVLRHITDAFREDPVRILRVARFAARFADFSVAPETMQLMREMVAHGEADHLVAERVWQELARGLMAGQPSRMLEVLRDCGALERLLPEIKLGSDPHLILDMSARLNAPLPVRFACLCHDLGDEKLLNDICQRLRIPTECRELAGVMVREHGNIDRSGACDATAVVRLLERSDAFRKPARFADLLLACECAARGRSGQADAAYPQRQRLLGALAAAQTVATEPIASQAIAAGVTGPKIGEMIHAARVMVVAVAHQLAA